MTAATSNILIEQGAIFSQQYTYTDSGGTPINLTGAKIAMQIRATAGDPVAQAEATTANGKIVLTDAANGVFTITLLPVDTSAVTVSGVYDIEYSAGGDTTATVRLLQGRAILSREVTLV